MIFLALAPNATRSRRASWHLAISRHDATHVVTSVHGAAPGSFQIRWLASTYPSSTGSTCVAPPLLFWFA